RAIPGVCALYGMTYLKFGKMRSDARTQSFSIARARRGKRSLQRHGIRCLLTKRVAQRKMRAREGALRAACSEFRVELLNRKEPCSRTRAAFACHGFFESVEPGRVTNAIAQQPQTILHRALIARCSSRMARIESEHQPVKKAAPVTGAFEKQPVHC